MQTNGPEEMLDIYSKLSTVETYYKKRQAELVDSNLLVAQRLRTERSLGEWLAANVKAGNPQLSHRTIIGLPDGVTPDKSSRWQRLSQVDSND